MAGKMKPRFQLSPELVDGDHWTVVDTVDELQEYIRRWCEEQAVMGMEVGENFTVTIVEMTDEEVEALPEI